MVAEKNMLSQLSLNANNMSATNVLFSLDHGRSTNAIHFTIYVKLNVEYCG